MREQLVHGQALFGVVLQQLRASKCVDSTRDEDSLPPSSLTQAQERAWTSPDTDIITQTQAHTTHLCDEFLALCGQPRRDLIHPSLDEPVQLLRVVVVKREESAEEGVEQDPQAPYVRLFTPARGVVRSHSMERVLLPLSSHSLRAPGYFHELTTVPLPLTTATRREALTIRISNA